MRFNYDAYLQEQIYQHTDGFEKLEEDSDQAHADLVEMEILAKEEKNNE